MDGFEISKTPPLPPTHEKLLWVPQSRRLAMRVLLRVVDGRRENIWLGVLIPISIPLVTVNPLAKNVTPRKGGRCD